MHALQIGGLARQAGETGIKRIADDRSDAENPVQLLARFRRQRRIGEAVELRHVEQQPAHAAREGDRARPLAARQPAMGEQFRDLHDIVEIARAHDARFQRHGVEGGHRARERAGVRGRRLPAFVGYAELGDDNGLAGGARLATRVEKALRIAGRFKVADDDLDRGNIGEIRDVVRAGEAGLVAASDQRAADDTALLQRALHGHDNAARLAEHGDGPIDEAMRPIVGHGEETRGVIEIAHAVGAGDGEPGLGDGGREIRRQRAALGTIGLLEAGGHDGGAARARRRALAQHRGNGFGGRQDHQMIGRLGHVGEVAIAASAPDFIARRVERIDRALVAVVDEIAVDARGPGAGLVAGADDGDVARVEQRVNLVGAISALAGCHLSDPPTARAARLPV